MIVLKVILLVLLLYTAYEDFRFRAISLYSVLLLLIAAIVYSVSVQGIIPAVKFMFLNLLIITFELILTWLWFAAVRKQKGFINRFIGTGDLLFYFPLLFLFSPLNFLIIHIVSLLLILAAFLFYKTVIRPVQTIPLAGGLAAVLILVLSLSWFIRPAMLYDDLVMADIFYSLAL